MPASISGNVFSYKTIDKFQKREQSMSCNSERGSFFPILMVIKFIDMDRDTGVDGAFGVRFGPSSTCSL